MKFLPLLLVTALWLLNPLVASLVDPESNASSSLEARSPMFDTVKPQEGQRVEKPVGGPIKVPPIVEDAGSPAGIRNTDKSVRARLAKLPGISWVKAKIDNRKLEDQIKAARGTNGGVGQTLHLEDTDGSVVDPRLGGLLEPVPGSKGNFFTLRQGAKYVFEEGDEPTYRQYTLSRQQAALWDSFHAAPDKQPTAEKRSILQTLNGQPNSTQEAADTFEQYLETLDSVQSLIGTLIAPVLSNYTTSINSSFIHQMAQSIYYDLTGSTVTMVGPFNYGMSFIGNQSTNSTGQAWTAMETLYTRMWFKAVTAANTTGLLAEQSYLSECLNTDDTSVYPPGFTTVSGK